VRRQTLRSRGAVAAFGRRAAGSSFPGCLGLSADLLGSLHPALARTWSTIQSGDGAPSGLTPHSKGFASFRPASSLPAGGVVPGVAERGAMLAGLFGSMFPRMARGGIVAGGGVGGECVELAWRGVPARRDWSAPARRDRFCLPGGGVFNPRRSWPERRFAWFFASRIGGHLVHDPKRRELAALQITATASLRPVAWFRELLNAAPGLRADSEAGK
jgi:hypothetical protein